LQKLSLLITEAYKDAHQKSVLVKILILKRKNKYSFASVVMELKENVIAYVCRP